MELSEIKGLETVKDRLAAGGPSGISPPHCWFCGKVEAWFRCDCRDATDARDGKRNKPRVVERDGHMLVILDPEVMAREHNQRRKRYVPPVHVAEIVHVDPESVDTVDTVDTSCSIVDSNRVNIVDTDASTVDAVDSPEDAAAKRRAYKAEHERLRRARQKET